MEHGAMFALTGSLAASYRELPEFTDPTATEAAVAGIMLTREFTDACGSNDLATVMRLLPNKHILLETRREMLSVACEDDCLELAELLMGSSNVLISYVTGFRPWNCIHTIRMAKAVMKHILEGQYVVPESWRFELMISSIRRDSNAVLAHWMLESEVIGCDYAWSAVVDYSYYDFEAVCFLMDYFTEEAAQTGEPHFLKDWLARHPASRCAVELLENLKQKRSLMPTKEQSQTHKARLNPL